jgi:hypothetical protein
MFAIPLEPSTSLILVISSSSNPGFRSNGDNFYFYPSGAGHAKMFISGTAENDFTAISTDLRDKRFLVLNLDTQVLNCRRFTGATSVDGHMERTVAHTNTIAFSLIQQGKTKNLLAETANLPQVFYGQRNMNNARHSPSFRD